MSGIYWRGSEWSSKGMFWALVANLGMIAAVGGMFVRRSIDDEALRAVILAFQLVGLAFQFGCIARMVFCYRRAGKIWAGKS